MKHMIYDSYWYLDNDRDSEMFKGYLEDYGMNNTEDNYWDFVNEESATMVDDVKTNLKSLVFDNGIVCLGEIEFWDGSRKAYKSIGNNLSNIFNVISSWDWVKFYVEDEDLKGRESHHDGTNFYMFRAWREGVEESKKEEALSQWLKGSPSMVEKLTEPLGDYVKKIYGWQ